MSLSAPDTVTYGNVGLQNLQNWNNNMHSYNKHQYNTKTDLHEKCKQSIK